MENGVWVTSSFIHIYSTEPVFVGVSNISHTSTAEMS